MLIKCVRSLLCASLLSCVISASAQQPPQPDTTDDDVLRINTELVQTDVVVLDKQGRFVEGLKPEQFQLRVDGKSLSTFFVEHVRAGTRAEAKLIDRRGGQETPANTDTTYRGRTIIFFIDDLHLSPGSIEQTRKALLRFVDERMSIDDQVVVASPSGQIGFLQRFTDSKAVLRAAIARLNHKPYVIRDTEHVGMTEYLALKIDGGDSDALSYFTEQLLKETNYRTQAGSLGPAVRSPTGGRSAGGLPSGGMTKAMAERNVRERAQFLLKQAETISAATLATLENLMRASSGVPGRKLLFFVSDGFYLNDRSTAFGDRLKQITDAATRSGVVVYSIDARGLVGTTDVTNNRADPQGRLARSNLGELSASQDPLTAVAADTGGKAFLNTGDLNSALNTALNETANYYVVAWRPETDEQKGNKFRGIEVSIKDRPELTVRLPKGFFVQPPSTALPATAAKETPTSAPPDKIRAALVALAVKTELLTQLSVGFIDVPNTGPVLTASTQVATNLLGYGADGLQTAAVDLAGVVLNDQGKQAGGFKTRLKINPRPADAAEKNPNVVYTYKVPLTPGIYLVRVAAQDEKNGRVGSAAQWIEIPDLKTKRLTLSSLMIGGQFIGRGNTAGGNADEQLQFSVDRRFAKGSHLNLLSFVYNANLGADNQPNLSAQIQITRNGQQIVTSPWQKIASEPGSDTGRVVYGADIGLGQLAAGRYVLQLAVNDAVAKTTAVRQVTFEIE